MDPTAETVNLEFTSNNIGNWTLILARRLEVTIKEFSRLVQKTRRPTEADFDHARYALTSLNFLIRHHKDVWLRNPLKSWRQHSGRVCSF